MSLHALARRFQRGFDTSDAAILSELKQIALRHEEIIEALGEFSLPADGGSWVGEVARTQVEDLWEPTLTLRSVRRAGAGRGVRRDYTRDRVKGPTGH